MNPLTDWIGAVAATLTTASFVPQAWLTFRSGDTRGISLGMYASFTTGVALWLVYGIALGEWPIIVANAITLTPGTPPPPSYTISPGGTTCAVGMTLASGGTCQIELVKPST